MTCTVHTCTPSRAELSWSWRFRWGTQEEAVPEWLSEVRRLRGWVLFDNGRRPAFGRDGAACEDADPLDTQCAHILVRHERRIVGCVRLMPLGEGQPGVTERLIGSEMLAQILASLGATREKTIEHGRWIVAPEYQKSGLGIYLMAASFALALKLGCTSSVAAASEQVVAILTHAGARIAPGVERVYSEKYRDWVIVLCGNQREFRQTTLAQFRHMAAVMKLGQIYDASPPSSDSAPAR